MAQRPFDVVDEFAAKPSHTCAVVLGANCFVMSRKRILVIQTRQWFLHLTTEAHEWDSRLAMNHVLGFRTLRRESLTWPWLCKPYRHRFHHVLPSCMPLRQSKCSPPKTLHGEAPSRWARTLTTACIAHAWLHQYKHVWSSHILFCWICSRFQALGMKYSSLA